MPNANEMWGNAGENVVINNNIRMPMFVANMVDGRLRIERVVDGNHPPLPAPIGANPEFIKPKEANGTELWDKLLYAVNEIYDNEFAIIAGGCVRDNIAGDDAKDIDIFLKLKYSLEREEVLELGQELGFSHIGLKGPAKGETYTRRNNPHNKTKLVLAGSVHGWNVDICFTDAADPEEVMKGFDFHICQHYYDGSSIRSTDTAQADMQKNLWTPTVEIDAESREHFDRVNRRVGGKYKLKEPLGEKAKSWYHNTMATTSATITSVRPW